MSFRNVAVWLCRRRSRHSTVRGFSSKGYIRPGSATSRTNIDNFLLVRDNNQCCFGDLSKVKYYDQMVVQITNKRSRG